MANKDIKIGPTVLEKLLILRNEFNKNDAQTIPIKVSMPFKSINKLFTFNLNFNIYYIEGLINVAKKNSPYVDWSFEMDVCNKAWKFLKNKKEPDNVN